jgi:hypothetical protein
VDDLSGASSVSKERTISSLLASGLSINEFMGMLKAVNLFNPTVPMQVVLCLLCLNHLKNLDVGCRIHHGSDSVVVKFRFVTVFVLL